MEFTKQNVLNWMHDNIEQFIDLQTNELGMTAMVEDAADVFGQKDQPGPLDDETHWIWDASSEVNLAFTHDQNLDDDGNCLKCGPVPACWCL